MTTESADAATRMTTPVRFMAQQRMAPRGAPSGELDWPCACPCIRPAMDEPPSTPFALIPIALRKRRWGRPTPSLANLKEAGSEGRGDPFAAAAAEVDRGRAAAAITLVRHAKAEHSPVMLGLDSNPTSTASDRSPLRFLSAMIGLRC